MVRIFTVGQNKYDKNNYDKIILTLIIHENAIQTLSTLDICMYLCVEQVNSNIENKYIRGVSDSICLKIGKI